ncbi:MAG: hypothetical protein ACYC4U_26230, partial [Pirellulaceae bacterium]
MWRSLFLAIGIVLCILGAECLVMEKAVLKGEDAPAPSAAMFMSAPLNSSKEIVPPEWAPWTLMSFGAVVVLYSYSIPRRTG